MDNPTLINCTAHPIYLPTGDLPPSGMVARRYEHVEITGTVAGVPVFAVCYGEVYGLPEPQEGTYYIVSSIVRTACPERADLLSPGRAQRDTNGTIVRCMNLVANGDPATGDTYN